MDSEKTCSGLTDACATAGRAGRRLVELTGDDANGDDVKALLNYAHDVVSSISRMSGPVDSVSALGGPPALL